MDLTGGLLTGVVVAVVWLVFTRTWSWFFVALCLAAILVLADMIAIGEDPRYPGTYLTLAVFQQIVLPGALLLVGLIAAVKALFLRHHLRRLAQTTRSGRPCVAAAVLLIRKGQAGRDAEVSATLLRHPCL